MAIAEETIRAYALENALEHGKTNEGIIINKLFNEGLEREGIRDIMPLVKKVVKEVNSWNQKKQIEEFEKIAHLVKKREVKEGLHELEDIERKIVMRIAPYPSGPLHIGNCRQMILNDEYVKKYRGKLLFVIDDTIGSEEKAIAPDAYKLIPEGLDWLKINYEKPIIYKSDRLEIYYKYAEQLISLGKAYVCSCSQEIIRDNRARGIECGCRLYPVEKQLERWKQMFKSKQGSFTLRLKTDMQHPDPAFRDRVLFRISEREHPRVGKKYRVWPLLEFSWAIDDHLLGITHIIRGTDLFIESKVEEFIWQIFKWPSPVLIHTGLLEIEGVKLSKSKGQKEVQEGRYIGWNDPRLWSLQSLRDRGIQPEAIRTFCLSFGLTKSETTVPVNALYSYNQKLIENSRRYFFIQDPVKIKIEKAPELLIQAPLHPALKLGFRDFKTKDEFFVSKKDYELLGKSGNFRLMHLFNIKSSGNSFKFVSKEVDKKLDAKFIHWVPAEDNIKASVRMPDGIIHKGLCESNIKSLKIGDIIQFERFGFCRFYSKEKGNYEFWLAHE
jgi:glutamyl-tRNA synthetase